MVETIDKIIADAKNKSMYQKNCATSLRNKHTGSMCVYVCFCPQ